MHCPAVSQVSLLPQGPHVISAPHPSSQSPHSLPSSAHVWPLQIPSQRQERSVAQIWLVPAHSSGQVPPHPSSPHCFPLHWGEQELVAPEQEKGISRGRSNVPKVPIIFHNICSSTRNGNIWGRESEKGA